MDFETRLLPNPTRPLCFEGTERDNLSSVPDRFRSQHRSLSTDRERWRIHPSNPRSTPRLPPSVSITTKSALIERDLDILSAMARDHLAQVQISITTLDKGLARIMEPRATSPQRRLQTIRTLANAGVPVTVMVAPVIPVLTDAELETILTQAAEHGAIRANYIMLRLPLEVTELFREWLETHFPWKAKHVLARMHDLHGGKLYDSRFGVRQSGSGIYADLIRKRFLLAVKKTGLNTVEIRSNSELFQRPDDEPMQTSLF